MNRILHSCPKTLGYFRMSLTGHRPLPAGSWERSNTCRNFVQSVTCVGGPHVAHTCVARRATAAFTSAWGEGVVIMTKPAAMVTWGFVHSVDVTNVASLRILGRLTSDRADG